MPKHHTRSTLDEKEAKRASEDILFDDLLITQAVIPYVRKCLHYEGLNNYKILRGSDCLMDMIDIFKDFSNPRSTVLVFTTTHVKVYKPYTANSKSTLYLYTRIGTTTIVNEDSFTALNNILRNKAGNIIQNVDIINQAALNMNGSIHGFFMKVNTTPRRGRGMPRDVKRDRNIPQEDYCILVRPNKQIIICKYDENEGTTLLDIHTQFTLHKNL